MQRRDKDDINYDSEDSYDPDAEEEEEEVLNSTNITSPVNDDEIDINYVQVATLPTTTTAASSSYKTGNKVLKHSTKKNRMNTKTATSTATSGDNQKQKPQMNKNKTRKDKSTPNERGKVRYVKEQPTNKTVAVDEANNSAPATTATSTNGDGGDKVVAKKQHVCIHLR